MIESAVTSKGQTTLPKAVRKSLDLEPGDRIRYIISGGEVRLMKARSIMELEGILKRPGQKSRSLEDMEQAIKKGALEGSP
jgi:antitoxin PrlF